MAVKTPSVDVIIPTYNGLPWLKATVESVLAQTHKELEVYIVDDGSTDKGATKKYAEGLTDHRVHYVPKTNGGQATARNVGISLSSSPYIAFVDSDDIWHADKLTRQLELFEQNPELGLVYGFHTLIDSKDKEVGKVHYAARGNLFRYLLSGNKISGSASMVLIPRQVFDTVGIFKEDLLIGEDWEMWLRIAQKYPIDYVPDYIADLRVLDNAMQKNHLKMARGLEYMLPIMVKEFRLGYFERSRLARTCLSDATVFYLDGGDIKSAHRTIWRLLLSSPLGFVRLEWWRWRDYLRAMFANEPLRVLRRHLSPAYRQRWQADREEREHE